MLAGLSLLAVTLATEAQVTTTIGQGGTQYDAAYPDPVDVPLDELLTHDALYRKKTVRTRGVLDVLGMEQGLYKLRDGGRDVMIIPVPELLGECSTLLGREVQVVGLVRPVPERQSVNPACGPESRCEDPMLPALPDRAGCPHCPAQSITIWRISDATRAPGPKTKPQEVTLEFLVSNPGRRDGQLVRVVGKFRGRNLYGDLPIKSQRSTTDWVIKDDLFAAWVTGKKPKGPGFDLDPDTKRDTGHWLEVVGRPLTRDGVTYLQARDVALTGPPTPEAEVQPPAPPPEVPKVPPVVVFALPLDGETDLARDSRFVVQFSKDMDEATFAGHVVLRYAGPVRPGDRPFVGLKLTYDGGRRALTVDPGDALRSGRQVELLLLPGIVDVDGLALVPRPGREEADAVDVLRYRIGT